MASNFKLDNVGMEEQFDLQKLESTPEDLGLPPYDSIELYQEEYKQMDDISMKDLGPPQEILQEEMDSWDSIQELDSFKHKTSYISPPHLIEPPDVSNEADSKGDSKQYNLDVGQKASQATHACSKESKESKLSDPLKDSEEEDIKVKSCLSRKDVVVKSILRSMRKYYVDLIQDNTNYRRKMRNIALKHKLLIKCSTQLVDLMGEEKFTKSLPFYLAAIAFPIDLKKMLFKRSQANPKLKKEFVQATGIICNVENALSKFSKKVMEEFMQMPEVCILLLRYLEKVHNLEYEEHYKMLKTQAQKSLQSVDEEAELAKNRIEDKIFELAK